MKINFKCYICLSSIKSKNIFICEFCYENLEKLKWIFCSRCGNEICFGCENLSEFKKINSRLNFSCFTLKKIEKRENYHLNSIRNLIFTLSSLVHSFTQSLKS